MIWLIQSRYQAIFDAKKFLLLRDATVENVKNEQENAAKAVEPRDYFLLTYSGHGGQLKDINKDEEYFQLDETWCLYDRQFVDDELNVYLGDFVGRSQDFCSFGQLSQWKCILKVKN